MRSQLNMYEELDSQTKRPVGNKKLVDYGIHNERSDFRAHVGYVTKRVFVFSTAKAVALVRRSGDQFLRETKTRFGQEIIVTSTGDAMPLSYFDDIQEIVIPEPIYAKYPMVFSMHTSTKGFKSTQIVLEMLRKNLIPLPVTANEAESLSLQISGTDILINSKLRLQVKCDWNAGPVIHGGSGNIYLQRTECNPTRSH